MELQITTRRWTLRVARRQPAAAKAPVGAPHNVPTPMRLAAGFVPPIRRSTKPVRVGDQNVSGPAPSAQSAGRETNRVPAGPDTTKEGGTNA